MPTLKGHGKPVIVLISAAKHGHSNPKRKKAPVQSSPWSSTEHEDECLRRKASIDHPQRHERSARAAPLLSPSVCRFERDTASYQSSAGGNDSREKIRDRTGKESPRFGFRPWSAASNHPPSEVHKFVNASSGDSSTDSVPRHAVENKTVRAYTSKMEGSVRSSKLSAPSIRPLIAGLKGAAGI